MHSYYKAYLLSDLSRYSGWPGDVTASQVSEADTVEVDDDPVVYLQDDYAVVGNPFAEDETPLFSSSSAEWRRFCHEELAFVAHESMSNSN
jgi:hypothetical protein